MVVSRFRTAFARICILGVVVVLSPKKMYPGILAVERFKDENKVGEEEIARIGTNRAESPILG